MGARAPLVGRGSPVKKNTLVALGVLLVALLIGLLWIFLAANYSGHETARADQSYGGWWYRSILAMLSGDGGQLAVAPSPRASPIPPNPTPSARRFPPTGGRDRVCTHIAHWQMC